MDFTNNESCYDSNDSYDFLLTPGISIGIDNCIIDCNATNHTNTDSSDVCSNTDFNNQTFVDDTSEEITDVPADYSPYDLNEFHTTNHSLRIDTQHSTNRELRPSEMYIPTCHIIAQPRSLYRARYKCERAYGNGTNRFIRAEDNENNYEYPTLQILPEWKQLQSYLYIRVTLATVPTIRETRLLIHPNEIDVPEDEHNVIRDINNNSLYVPINDTDFMKGEKSFRIILTKQTQEALKLKRMRLFDFKQSMDLEIDTPSDVREKKWLYDLNKAQLIFMLAIKQRDNSLPESQYNTLVGSSIMNDIGTTKLNTITKPNATELNHVIKIIPRKSHIEGGEEVIIILSQPIQIKVNSIVFDFNPNEQHVIHSFTLVNKNTISFHTPICPIRTNQQANVSIIIIVDNSTLKPVQFYYLAPTRAMWTKCEYCQHIQSSNISNNILDLLDEQHVDDSGENLLAKFKQLSIAKEKNKDYTRIKLDENDSNFEKYLTRLKVALERFVRTNDPSRLFRQTRTLLARCDENPAPLNEAIQCGHTDLALSLIQQVLDMSPTQGLLERENEHGETPLLIAAKLNQWKLIEPIVKNRLDLVKRKDKAGNNLLHLLAKINQDESAETIRNIMKVLPNELKEILLKEKNKSIQTPLDIAQTHENPLTCELLIKNITRD